MVVIGYQSGNDRWTQSRANALSVAWERFAAEVGGRYLPTTLPHLKIGHGMPGVGKVFAPAPPWEICFETDERVNEIPMMTVRAIYRDHCGLAFCINRPGPLYYIADMLGYRDIRVGEFLFDDAFHIRGNQPDRIRQLFEDQNLRQLIVAHESFWMRGRPRRRAEPNSPPTAELVYGRVFATGDSSRLHRLHELFVRTLGGLTRVGATEAIFP